MPDLMDESFRFRRVLWDAAWNKGTYLARVVIGIVLIWPLVLIGVASPLPPQTAISVVPLVTIACMLLVLLGPSKLAILEIGFSRYIARIVVPFLLIGLYCSFIPLGNVRALVPAVALIWYVILFLFWGGRHQWGTIAAILLMGFSLACFPGALQTIRNVSQGNRGAPVSGSIFPSVATDEAIVTEVCARFWRDPALRVLPPR